MAKKEVVQTFTKGYTGDASPFVLDLSQVSKVENMLFERGLLISRPAVINVDSNTASGSIVMKAGFGPINIANFHTYGFMAYSPGLSAAAFSVLKIRSLTQLNNGTPFPFTESADATGPAINTGFWGVSSYDIPWTQFQGLYILSNITDAGFGGVLVAYNPVANTYTTIAIPNNFEGVTTHLSRVIAISPTLGSAIVYWSKIGDATIWTGHFTAGSIQLQEAEDGLSNIDVLRNVLVVARPQGFHVGVPTGTGANPYDWRCLTNKDRGSVYRQAWAKGDGKFFFISESDVHTFDLNEVEDIGESIRTELFYLIRTLHYVPRGYYTRTYKDGARPQYHIILTWVPVDSRMVSGTTTPSIHFVYDVLEKFWSRHTYAQHASDPLPMDGFVLNWLDGDFTTKQSYTSRTQPAFLIRQTTPPRYAYWDNNFALDAAQFFETGKIALDSPATEGKLVRVMIVASSLFDNYVASCTVTQYLGNTTATHVYNFTLNSGWNRVWINNVNVGQFFSLRFDFPTTNRLEVRQLILDTEAESQEARV